MRNLDDIRDHLGRHGQRAGPAEVAGALRALGHLVSDATVRATVEALRRDSVGAGPLDPLLGLPGVIDVVGTTLNGAAQNLALNTRSVPVRGAVTHG